jgi:hypothetical protein
VWTSSSNYTFNGTITWCWGGGIPYVHWGYVFNCQTGLGSPNDPYMYTWFSNVAQFGESIPYIYARNYHWFGWANMNYSPNTGYYDWKEGFICAQAPLYGCIINHYPTILMDVYANGAWDWTANNGGND